MITQAVILSGSLIFIYMIGVFIISLLRRDNSIVDTAYGIGFILVAWSTYAVFGSGSFVQLLITTCITIWGLRLAFRIYKRNSGKPEDFRYKKWRDTWSWFKTRSFFQIYMLQGLIIVGISCVAIITNASTISNPSLIQSIFIVIGSLLWVVGFVFESVGDYQLDSFIKKGSGGIMKGGLWSLTRHPNYFGEVTMWWGLWLITLSTPLGWMSIISPLIITYLLLKVSGIPMLEAKYIGNAEYEQYQKETNAFFPWKKKV